MKSASVISLFIALVLIVSGVFMCAKARSMAPNDQAIDGNTVVENGRVVTEVLLTGQTFSNVNINVKNCKVEIHGNADTSSVTFVNFNENTYIASSSEKTLTISNKISLLDFINLDGKGVKFSGVWKTLRSFLSYDTSKGEQEIHIYLAKDAEISKINIACSEKANVRALDFSYDCDLAFTVNESYMEISNINAGAMTIGGSKSEISLGNADVTSFEYLAKDTTFTSNNVLAENLTIDTKSSDISLLNTEFRVFNTTLEKGNLTLSTRYDVSSYFRKIEIAEGEILRNDTPIGQKDNSPEELFGKLPGNMTVSVGSGSLSMTFGSDILPPEAVEDPTATPAA